MRLHPVTWILLFAVLLRLATDDVTMLRLSELLAQPAFADGFWAIKARAVSGQMTDVAQALSNLGLAAVVELLSRWASRLKTARLGRSATTGMPA